MKQCGVSHTFIYKILTIYEKNQRNNLFITFFFVYQKCGSIIVIPYHEMYFATP